MSGRVGFVDGSICGESFRRRTGKLSLFFAASPNVVATQLSFEAPVVIEKRCVPCSKDMVTF